MISKPSTDTVKLDDNSVWNSRDLLIKSKSFAADLPIEQPTPAIETDTQIDDQAPGVDASEETEGDRNLSEPPVLDRPKDLPLLDPEPPVRRSTREHHPPARYNDFVRFL